MVSPDFERLLCESLQALESALKLAGQEAISDARGAAITSLQGVVAFINAMPRLESQNLALPLTELMGALNDLNVGRVGPIVKPTTGFDNRKPEASFRKVIRAYATHGVDLLKRRGMTVENACKFVAVELAYAHVPTGGGRETPAWQTVKDWRYKVSKLSPGDQERHTVDALKAECAFPENLSLEQLKEQLSAFFRSVVLRLQATLE